MNRLIHAVWIDGHLPRPLASMRSWGPDLRVWSDSEAEGMRLESSIQAMIEEENLPGAADLMRYEILATHGGACVDADMTLLQPIPEWIWQCDCAFPWESELIMPGLATNCFIRARSEHPLFVSLVDHLIDHPPDPKALAWQTTGPALLSSWWRLRRDSTVTILPSHLFLPTHHTGWTYTGNGPVIAANGWQSTKALYHYDD